MFARCTCTCVARCAELPTGLYYITDLYSNLLKVHISTLYLAAIRSGIFHSQRFSTGRVLILIHSHHLPLFSVASTASPLQRISIPLCICCFVLSIGSCRIPKGEVTKETLHALPGMSTSHHTLNFQTFGEDYVPYRTAYPVSPFPASPVCHTAVSHFAL